MIASASAAIAQTPAARPSTPSMKLVTLTIATIAEHGHRIGDPAELEPADEGQRQDVDPDPAEHRDQRRRRSGRGASAAPAGRRRRRSAPTSAIAAAPSRIERVSPSPGSQISPATSTATRIARPESFGVGSVVQARGPGGSRSPRSGGRAARPSGTSSQAIAAATMKARTASVVDGHFVRPRWSPEAEAAEGSGYSTAPRTPSTSSSGSRRTRSAAGAPRFRSSSSPGSSRTAQPALGDQPLVDPAHAAGERRVDRASRGRRPRGSSCRRR